MVEKREVKLYLNDIIDPLDKINLYVKNLTEDEFKHNLEKQASITRRFEIIGEAVKNVLKDIRILFPKVPWRKITGLRDVLIHNYMALSLRDYGI